MSKMNEAPQIYHNLGIEGGDSVLLVAQGERHPPRQYPLEVLQGMGGMARNGSPAITPRRQNRNHRRGKGDNTAFGYESDDSSQSSNASGSNKSSEKGEVAPRTGAGQWGVGQWGAAQWSAREWRGRRRDAHTQRPRRPPYDRYLHASYPFQVKYTPDDLLNGSEWDTMSQEIWDKFMKSQQTEETFNNKMNLWRYLYVTIKSIFPRYGLYVVGSTMSGFGLDTSDMDLCLYVRPGDAMDARSHALVHLHYILPYVRTLDHAAQLILAKVPILKFRDAHAGLQVDLNCNNVVGLRNTSLLYWWSRYDWRARPLVAAAKLWARAHDINDARHRTLSSYALTLMVVHFLQCGTSPAVLPAAVDRQCSRVPRPHNRCSLAELFVLFLKYYAEFPYDTMAVSVRVGAPLPIAECRAARTHKNDPHQWKLLCVEEPFDLTNTARSVYDPETFEKIVQTFRDSYRRCSAARSLAAAWPQPAR